MALGVDPAGDERPPDVKHEQVQHVAFAVGSDAGEIAGLDHLPHFRPVAADFARQPQRERRLVKLQRFRRAVIGERVHQVAMGFHGVAVAITRPTVGCLMPVRDRDAVHEGSLHEDRQVEAATVPRDDTRLVTLEPAPEAPEKLLLGRRDVAARPAFLDGVPLGRAFANEGRGEEADRDDAVLNWLRWEIVGAGQPGRQDVAIRDSFDIDEEQGGVWLIDVSGIGSLAPLDHRAARRPWLLWL